MIDIRRVTRVVAGGRRFSFSVALVAGDKNGRVGFGMGKATDTSLAIEKAFKDARKNMLTLRLTKTKSIRHDLYAKFGSASLTMMPNKGRGLIAGSSARVVLAFAGVKDVTAKYQSGTKNKINNAKAAIKALSQIAYKHGEAPVRKVELKVEGEE
jgi:small subunit ribosomal protein S5